MKSYNNKKIYNFTPKHKGKKRTKHTMRWGKLGSEYTKEKRREYRFKCKAILHEKLAGKLIEFPLYKKTMWWDS